MGLQEEILKNTEIEKRDAILKVFREQMRQGSDYIRGVNANQLFSKNAN